MGSVATPFTCELGTSQGRIYSYNWRPVDGSWLFCLGCDRSGVVWPVNANDRVAIANDVDVTGIPLIRFTAHMRSPAQAPPGGLLWMLRWYLGGLERGSRVLYPGKAVDVVGAIPCRGLTGVQPLALELILFGIGGGGGGPVG